MNIFASYCKCTLCIFSTIILVASSRLCTTSFSLVLDIFTLVSIFWFELSTFVLFSSFFSSSSSFSFFFSFSSSSSISSFSFSFSVLPLLSSLFGFSLFWLLSACHSFYCCHHQEKKGTQSHLWNHHHHHYHQKNKPHPILKIRKNISILLCRYLKKRIYLWYCCKRHE